MKKNKGESAFVTVTRMCGVEIFTARHLQSILSHFTPPDQPAPSRYTNNRAIYAGVTEKHPAMRYIGGNDDRQYA
ncbi:MAG: hypothetical protein QMD46_13180 [Methanomicrobiales archaeon]|nr:hypothetical protein [Methanomicrobiales archaeon]